MQRRFFRNLLCHLLGLALLVGFCVPKASAAENSSEETLSPLVKRVVTKLPSAMRADAERLYALSGNALLFTEQGKVGSAAKNALTGLDAVTAHGLDPRFYLNDSLRGQLVATDLLEEERAVAFEAKVVEALMLAGSHLCSGRFDAYTRKERGYLTRPECDISQAIANGVRLRDLVGSMDTLAPKLAAYAQLKAHLPKMREVVAQGSWPEVAPLKLGDKIEPGMTDERIVAVRRRLEASGELSGAAPTKKRGADVSPVVLDETVYDDKLKEAVIRFQERHGLTADGVIGRGTASAMNVPASFRLCQMKLALDRLRALASDLAQDRFIIVNVPDFKVRVQEGGKTALEIKAIVGRVDRKTPMMKDLMRLIVFSPQWHVPYSIAVKDKLPEVKKDPQFFEKHGMRLYGKTENGVEEVDPASIDWNAVDSGSFDYSIVQKTGDDNALGRIKFLFPNKDNVYLHDTPTKSLFKNAVRTFSSGCVRIESPEELAVYLLKDAEGWDRPRIEAAMQRKGELAVPIPNPIPISIVYLTAWVDADGTIAFRDDIYGHDRALAKLFCRDEL